MCSGAATQRQTRFISSQNAALVSFNIPTPGQGFRVRVTHHPNPDSKGDTEEETSPLTLCDCS